MGRGENKLKNESKDLQNNNILQQYEKIGGLTLKLGWWYCRLFDLAIYLFLLSLYMISVVSIRTPPPPSEDLSFLILEIQVIFGTSFLLFILSVILMFFSLIYEWIKKYDVNLVIKLLFYELSKKPNLDRRNDIIEHITYNIWKIRRKYAIKRFLILKTPSNRMFQNFIRNEKRIKVEILDKIMRLIEKSSLDWLSYDIEELYKGIGDNIEQENYLGLVKIINDNKNKFMDFNDIRTEIQNKAMRNKIARFGGWFSRNYKAIIYAFFIFTMIMYLLGIIQAPIHLPI